MMPTAFFTSCLSRAMVLVLDDEDHTDVRRQMVGRCGGRACVSVSCTTTGSLDTTVIVRVLVGSTSVSLSTTNTWPKLSGWSVDSVEAVVVRRHLSNCQSSLSNGK